VYSTAPLVQRTDTPDTVYNNPLPDSSAEPAAGTWQEKKTILRMLGGPGSSVGWRGSVGGAHFEVPVHGLGPHGEHWSQ